MDFTLDKKHEMARELFKEFAEKEVKPLAMEIDEEHRFPSETVEKMAKAGFLGIPVPKEYGGQGCDVLTYIIQLILHFVSIRYLHMEHLSRRKSMLQILLQERNLVHSLLQSQVQVLMLRCSRQRLYLMVRSGFLMDLSASLQMVR